MKRMLLLFLVVVVASLAACNDTKQEKPVVGDDVHELPSENSIGYELLLHLDFIPHEVGNSMTLVQDEALYQSWAEIFRFETIPPVDFATEEVLFVTAYSNGCGLVMDTLTQQQDTLIVALNFPENLRGNKEIVCTEIALQNTYVIKMPKTGATKGTLTAPNTVLLENENIIP